MYFTETPEYNDPDLAPQGSCSNFVDERRISIEQLLEDYKDGNYKEGEFVPWEHYEDWDKEYMIANIVTTANSFYNLHKALLNEKINELKQI